MHRKEISEKKTKYFKNQFWKNKHFKKYPLQQENFKSGFQHFDIAFLFFENKIIIQILPANEPTLKFPSLHS